MLIQFYSPFPSRMAALKYCIVVLAACVGVALSYSTGAPTEACQNLTPQHGPVQPRTTPFPYNILLSKTGVAAGETIKVTIQGKSKENKIAGFMIQARDGSLPIGQFGVIEGTKSQLVKCNNNAVSFSRRRLTLNTC